MGRRHKLGLRILIIGISMSKYDIIIKSIYHLFSKLNQKQIIENLQGCNVYKIQLLNHEHR